MSKKATVAIITVAVILSALLTNSVNRAGGVEDYGINLIYAILGKNRAVEND